MPSMKMPARLQLEPRDLLVELLRQDVDRVVQRGVVGGHVLGRERLAGEAHVHDRGRMALGRAEVDQPALGQQVQLLLAEVVLPDVLADLAHVALGQPLQRGELELGVEVAGVA